MCDQKGSVFLVKRLESKPLEEKGRMLRSRGGAIDCLPMGAARARRRSQAVANIRRNLKKRRGTTGWLVQEKTNPQTDMGGGRWGSTIWKRIPRVKRGSAFKGLKGRYC